MGKKARDYTPELPPLDDDANWLPIEPAHKRLIERFKDTAFLPVAELMKALADGRLPCMARSTAEERKLIPATAWVDQFKLGFGLDLRVEHFQPLHQFKSHYVPNPVRGWDFFFWQPAFNRIRPPRAASAPPVDHDDDSAPKEPLRPIDVAKAVLPDVYPPDGKPPRALTLKAVTTAVANKCRERGWHPPSQDTVARALEDLGHRTPRTRG
jgi:hypothetical protein